MTNLTITTDAHKRVDVVTVAGRVDSSNAHQLDDTFKSLAGNNRHNYVVALDEVNYMSSAGLRALNSALRSSKKDGGNLVLVSPSDRVQEVLNLAGLDAIFTSYDDLVDAVGSF